MSSMVTAAGALENTFEAFFALDVLETALADDLRSPVCDERFPQICTFFRSFLSPTAGSLRYLFLANSRQGCPWGRPHACRLASCLLLTGDSIAPRLGGAHPCSFIREQS